MTLRRTALARRAELKRQPKRRRNTDPTAAQRRVVAERAGYACELCRMPLHDGHHWTEPHSFHHRQPRGMGGTNRPDVHAPYQLLLLCGTDNATGCHGYIESHRRVAYENGWLVHHGRDAATTPAIIGGATTASRHLVLLTADGRYEAAE